MKKNILNYNFNKKEQINSNSLTSKYLKNLKFKIFLKKAALKKKLKLSYYNSRKYLKKYKKKIRIKKKNIRKKEKKKKKKTYIYLNSKKRLFLKKNKKQLLIKKKNKKPLLIKKKNKKQLLIKKKIKKQLLIKKKNKYNKLIGLVYKKFKKKYKSYNDSYINNLHILYQDSFINKFINVLLLKKGKRYNAFKIFLQSLLILKKITCISPIRIIKSLLRVKRMIITFYSKRRGSKLIKIPKINSKKNLYLKYLFHMKKSLLNLSVLKHYSASEKLAYLILFNLLKLNNMWKKLISDNLKATQLYEHKRLLLYKKY